MVLFEFSAGLMKLQHRRLNIKCNSTLHPVIGKLGTLVLLENGPKSMKGIGYSSLSRTQLQEFAFTDNCSQAWCARDSTFASSPQTYATAAFGEGRVRDGANLLWLRCQATDSSEQSQQDICEPLTAVAERVSDNCLGTQHLALSSASSRGHTADTTWLQTG